MSGIGDRERLIVALDVASVDEARDLVRRLGNAVEFYKVGLELVMRGGLDLVRELKQSGKSVFLDMKFLDIGNTVEKAVAGAAKTGADLVTIHGIDTKTVTAAVKGTEGSGLRILGVTVLTSLDMHDLAEQGIAGAPADVVLSRAKITCAAGGHGIVASGQEAAAIRSAIGPGKLIVTPGIRLPTDDVGDQKRVATPLTAIRDGADYIVVGRPITQAKDPKAAAEMFQAEIAKARAV